LQRVFKEYDTDKSGMLNASELRQALNSAGYQLNCRILNVLVHRYGTKDGQITFDDFIASAVRLKCMIGKIAYAKMLISLFLQNFFY
jgi:calpain, invertebrate